MPIKLTSSDRKVIGAAALTALVSLGIGAKYFWRAFPEAAIEFRVNRNDSAPIAQKFLAERSIHVEGYRHAAIFDYDDAAKVYLERTQGLERMNKLTRGPIRLWRWQHRWFRPQQQEEFRVEVSPTGEVTGFQHEIPEAASGANLEAVAARGIAERFLREVVKRDLADLEFVEGETQKRPARTDHDFTWKQKSVDLGDGSWRVEVEVDGDQVAGYREFVKIPEQWSRDYQKLRSRNQSAQLVDEVLFVLLTVAMLVILVRRLRDRDVPVKLSVVLGLVATALYFLGQLNNYPMAEYGYSTTDSFSSFVAGYFQRSALAALGVGAWVFFLAAGSEPVYRAGYPGLMSLRRSFSWQGLRSRSFFLANVVGITLTFFFFAYQTVFYLAANRLGAWAPSDVNYSDLLSTKIPWVWVLFIGFLPAVSEELQFRAFAIPFLRRILRSKPAALVLAAFIWGFLHSAYPNQPFFIRGLEVGLGGVIIGLVMLRFGILATLIWHYSVDALYTAFLLLRSPNHYLMVSGALTAGIMLVPLAIALFAYFRTGTFAEESGLTNASAGVSRVPRAEPAPVAESPLDYRPLGRRHLVLAAVLAAVFVGLALLPARQFGEGIELRLDRGRAEQVADSFLRQRDVDPATYHRAAWLRVNVDPTAVKYLLEHRTVTEADQIYRQATRLLLWQVRYFRPLEKEEHLVFVDPVEGKLFSYRHILDENAPGASLSPEEARTRAAEFLERQGYRLEQFDLQDSRMEKRKARTDYTVVWQMKPGLSTSPLNVADAHFRLEVSVAGDEVVGLSRYFKLPEEWERQRRATTLVNIVLIGALALLVVGLVGGALILFVTQVRRGAIRWRPAAKVGAAIVAIVGLAEANQFSRIYQAYNTSEPLSTFWISTGAGLLIVPLLLGLVAWVLVGLAVSLYPNAWQVFRGSARRVWRRDALIGLLLSLATGAGLSNVESLVTSRFHAFASPDIDIVPDVFDASSPGLALLLRGLRYALVIPAIVAVIVYLFQWIRRRRAGWVWVVVALAGLGLGPIQAHSAAEFLVGWSLVMLTLAIAVVLVVFFFRDNCLAYVCAAFALPLAAPLVDLLSQPVASLRWNGVLLTLLALAVLGWMLWGSREARSAS
jgi:membrane protease YdiL (CAAX protease family)